MDMQDVICFLSLLFPFPITIGTVPLSEEIFQNGMYWSQARESLFVKLNFKRTFSTDFHFNKNILSFRSHSS